MNTLHRHCHPNPDYYSHAPASENSVDIAAPIVSALQAPPTKAQVMMMVVVMVMVLMIMMVMMVVVMTETVLVMMIIITWMRGLIGIPQAQSQTSTPSAAKARQPESHKLIIGDHIMIIITIIIVDHHHRHHHHNHDCKSFEHPQ